MAYKTYELIRTTYRSLRTAWRFCLLILLAALLSTCTAFPSLAPPAPPPAPPPVIRIGVLAPFSGELASVGASTRTAAELAVASLQAQGGLMINGQPYTIELVIGDSQDNPEAAVQAAQRLINQEGIVALIGPQASRNAIPVAAVAESAQIPMISPWSTNPATTADKAFVFRVGFIDPFQGRVLARFVYEDLELKRAAVLYDVASAYNRGLAEEFMHHFRQAGGIIVAAEKYTTGDTDLSNQLAFIRRSRAQVLFLPNYHNEVPLQVEQARTANVTIPVIGSDSWHGMEPDDRAPVEGAFFSAHFAADGDNDRVRDFVERYTDEADRLPDDVAALTYDAFGMLFTVIEAQQSFESVQIRQGLHTLHDYPGVTGTISYEHSGDPVKSVVLLRITNGQFVFHQMIDP